MPSVKITNKETFKRSLENLEKKLIAAAMQGLEESGGAIVDEARERVPVKTGRLKDSIGLATDEDALSVTVKADTPYAKFVEFGTFKTPARPFFLPAVEHERPKTAGRVADAIKKAMGQ